MALTEITTTRAAVAAPRRTGARWLLLIYSMSPAAAKLMGFDALFGLGLLLLIAYFFLDAPGGNGDCEGLAVLPQFSMLAFAVYGTILGLVLVVAQVADSRAVIVGGFSFLVPVLIVGAAGPQRAARLLHDLPFVAAAQALLALVMFSPIRLPFGPIDALSETLLTGTAAFRLSSVGGSLALSTTMVAAFAVAVYQHVHSPQGSPRARHTWQLSALFLVCGFLSLQRAAWLSLALIWIVATVVARSGKRRSVGLLLGVGALPVIAGLLFVDVPRDVIDIFIDRFDSLTGGGEVGAVAERSEQWLNVAYNLRVLPIGHGPGQLGQPIRDSWPTTGGLPIFDGDYFRIVSEYGPAGAGFVALMLAGGVRALANGRNHGLPGQGISGPILAIATVGLLVQAVGTNVSELYFANTVFWCLWIQNWTTLAPLGPQRNAC